MLDEYALILHLSDVYWSEDGRTSVDAVFAAVAVGGLLIMGLHPLMFFLPMWHGADSMMLRALVGGAMVLTLPLAVVVVLKGKVWTGLLGMFLVVLLVIGAVRLSRPHAPWARWRYSTQPEKMRRALQRKGRCAARWCGPSCICSAPSPARPDFPTSAPSMPRSTTRSIRHRRPPVPS